MDLFRGRNGVDEGNFSQISLWNKYCRWIDRYERICLVWERTERADVAQEPWNRKQNPVFFQAEDGIRDVERSRGLGDVYKRQVVVFVLLIHFLPMHE